MLWLSMLAIVIAQLRPWALRSHRLLTNLRSRDPRAAHVGREFFTDRDGDLTEFLREVRAASGLPGSTLATIRRTSGLLRFHFVSGLLRDPEAVPELRGNKHDSRYAS